MTSPEERTRRRGEVLSALGATDEQREELLRYGENVFRAGDLPPLTDEPFVEAWSDYARECEEAGSLAPLARHLVQLRFPVRAGISEDPDYAAASRRGIDPAGLAAATGLELRAPERARVVLHPTPAGRIPVILTGAREDFVALVRALSHRNEPHPVPDSMGACTIGGYNDWGRVRRLRARFEQAHPEAGEEDWKAEFQRMVPQRDLYQDRFIILSDGPYSGVSARAMGLDEEEWRKASLTIRLEHECTHYFTKRVLSSMRKNALDELLCDFAGIVAARGRFDRAWLMRFLGLEDHPRWREGGRLANYLGEPPLREGSFALLRALVFRAGETIERAQEAAGPPGDAEDRAAWLLALAALTLEEIACEDGPRLLGEGVVRQREALRAPRAATA